MFQGFPLRTLTTKPNPQHRDHDLQCFLSYYMAENPAEKSSKSSKQELDLNSLSGLDFGPSWADPTAKRSMGKHAGQSERSDHAKRPAKNSGPRDRRAAGARPNRQGGEGRGAHFSSNERRERKEGHGVVKAQKSFFKPVVKVDLYPQDEAFEALVKRLRSTVRTYQLFEIAHLLLEKPERYVAVVSNFPTKGGGAS